MDGIIIDDVLFLVEITIFIYTHRLKPQPIIMVYNLNHQNGVDDEC